MTKYHRREDETEKGDEREKERTAEKSRGVLPTNWKFNELEQRERAFRTKEEED